MLLNDRPKWMHVYGQASQHDEVVIIGNVAALTALRNAIDSAITQSKGSCDVFANDGEGYGVYVLANTKEEIGRLVLPYTADEAKDTRARQQWPSLACFQESAQLPGTITTEGE